MNAKTPATMPREILLVESAKRDLAEAQTIDEVKNIRDKAAAVKLYMQQAGECLEAQNAAAEIKLRAERKAGELLKEMEKNKGELLRGDKPSQRETSDKQPKLEDLGVTRKQSSRWQQAASVPEPVFEKHVEETKAAGKPLTTTGVANLAREQQPNPQSPHIPAKTRRRTRKHASATDSCAKLILLLDQTMQSVAEIKTEIERTNGAFGSRLFDLPEQMKRLSLARKLLSQIRTSIKG